MQSHKDPVEESEKIRKTREKLVKHLEVIDQNVTRQALERKSVEIHRWIARHASSRVVLKNKSISLYETSLQREFFVRRAAMSTFTQHIVFLLILTLKHLTLKWKVLSKHRLIQTILLVL